MPSPILPVELGKLVKEMGRAWDADGPGGEFVGDNTRCENVSGGEA